MGEHQSPPPAPPAHAGMIKLKKPRKVDLTEEAELLRHLNIAHAKMANSDTVEEGTVLSVFFHRLIVEICNIFLLNFVFPTRFEVSLRAPYSTLEEGRETEEAP